jgi:hypothetical protein
MQWQETCCTSAGCGLATSPPSCATGRPARALAAAQVVLHNPSGMNTRLELWSQWSHDLHHLIDMAQRRTDVLGQAMETPSTTHLAAADHGTGPYLTGHLVHLVALVHVTSTYCMMVNDDTTISITNMHVLRTFFLPITGDDFTAVV